MLESELLLAITNMDKRFPGVHALKGVQFDLRAGEVHALLGENGAGKSTLIKVIAGVHQPDLGEMQLEGQPVHFASPRAAIDRGVITIHQELSSYPELTVAENIFMGREPIKRAGPLKVLDWDTMRRRARELLAELGAESIDVDQPVGTFNVGNRQRIEIARALALDAHVLIMDEPTAPLTESDVESLFRTVRMLRDRGVGIVYISHKLGEVFDLADRVTVLRDGEYIGTRNVAETSEHELINMMVGRDIGNLFPKAEAELGDVVLEVKGLVNEPYTRNVSFKVRRGEIVGLAGLVGAGRSETAQAIFGIRPLHGGEVLVRGKKVSISHPSDAVRHGIAYVPEDRGLQGLVRPMTVRENLTLAALDEVSHSSFIDSGAEHELALDAITRFGIRTYGPEQVTAKLSGGNQQKIVVSKWLARQPDILIIDEPTRGVDVGAKAEIHRLLSQLAVERGLAILMISSELPEILGMSDRVLVMSNGRLVAEFTKEEATQENIGAAMMRGHAA